MSGENVNRHPENVNWSTSEGRRRRALTKDDMKKYVLAQIGYPVTEVELASQQFEILFERVLDEYNKWLPVYKVDVITAVSSMINRYNLLDLNQPFGRGVVDVKIVTQQQWFSPISGVFALGIPHPISHLAPDQYDLALRYIKMAKKIYSSEPDWEWEEPVLWLYAPTGFGGPFSAAYTYSQDCSCAEDIAAEDAGWAKDYYLALVKIAVGESRAKFGGIPGPAGQQLRGADLVRDGKEEKKELEQKIESKSYARIPPLGLSGG